MPPEFCLESRRMCFSDGVENSHFGQTVLGDARDFGEFDFLFAGHRHERRINEPSIPTIRKNCYSKPAKTTQKLGTLMYRKYL